MPALVDTVPATVLAVYAHPDDPEVSCGGTLATWAGAGAEVHCVIGCQGDKGSSDPDCDPAKLVVRRAEETAEAAALLGVTDFELLGYPDGELEDTVELRGRLVEIVRRVRPDVVVCPDPTAAFFGRTYINHRDHRVIGWAVLDAVAPAAWSPLYFPHAGPAHRVGRVFLSGTLNADIWVDVSEALTAKAAALACHRSQLGDSTDWLQNIVRSRAEEAGRAAGVRYAEGFRLLEPS